MIAFAAIDGTGDFWNGNYKKNVTKYSHVARFYREWSHSNMKYYQRGPWTLGTDSALEVGRAFAWVQWQFQMCGAKALVMAGHSRGAAAVVEVAWYLKQCGIKTDALLLFDAVDRSIVMGSPKKDTPLVNTIGEAHHAFRDLNTRSRESFGNCVLTMETPTNMIYSSKYFWSTHGAVGGTYWMPDADEGQTLEDYVNEGFPDWETAVKFREDKAGAEASWNWMKPRMDGAIRRIHERLGVEPKQPAGNYPGTNPGNPGGGGPHYGPPGNGRPGGQPGGGKPGGGAGGSYQVVQGDSLSLIAGKYWSDVLLWPIIWDNNKGSVPNPNLVQIGQRLSIPSISGMTPSQLEAARTRGRNWQAYS